MDKNLLYMQELKIDEVPWNRITTAYGRATEFPRYFKILWDMADKLEVEKALKEVISNIEHQGTLWHSTPFAMIFLVRIFRKAVSEKNSNEMAVFIVEHLLNFFDLVALCCKNADEMEHEDQVPFFSDMLKEEYLWSEEYNEEEDIMCYEEDEVFPDNLFYSFYYYSYLCILSCDYSRLSIRSK